MIGITQPRRMAAISLAKRVAVELGTTDPGDDESGKRTESERHSAVGFAIRFQDRTTRHTRIKFMTDGWLLREFVRAASHLLKDGLDLSDISDPHHPSLLPQYSVLIIDEAHERSVRTDLVLGLAKRIQMRRRQLRQAWEARSQAGKLKPGEVEPELLRMVIMSATLDAKLFADFFGSEASSRQTLTNGRDDASNAHSDSEVEETILSPRPKPTWQPAPVLYVKGRTYPVVVNHLIEAADDWIDAAKRQILWLHTTKPVSVDEGGGDILVFGTGAEEIETLTGSLRQLSEHIEEWAAEHEKTSGQQRTAAKLLVVPLYAALGSKAVNQVYKPTPPNVRKIVIATNIAETSVTIPGIRFVVDCGLAKEKMHISHNSIAGAGIQDGPSQSAVRSASSSAAVGIETLTTRAISKSAAAQRAGRAGREAAGECFRLYPQTEFDNMEQTTVPEIHRTELTSVALDCFSAGVDPREVEWVDRPDENKLGSAIFELASMGAVESKTDAEGYSRLVLTPLGSKMALLPLPPRFSHFLIVAARTSSPKIVCQARDLVAILSSERSVFAEPTASMAAAAAAAEAGTKSHGTSGDLPEFLEERRFAAEKAKSMFRHRSGDHVTMLKAFYRFVEARKQIEAESVRPAVVSNGRSNGNRPGHDGPEARLKSWCNNHFISLRAMREIEDIREQITGICRRAGILLVDEEEHSVVITPNRVQQRKDVVRSSERHDDSTDDEIEDDLPMTVTRGSKSTTANEEFDDEGYGEEDDYVELRRCLVSGRSTSNLAIRTSELEGGGGNSTTYKVLCGRETFKLHPTSSLHPRNLKKSSPPKLIVFEELQYTTQMYVRTASEVDIEWVQDAARKDEERSAKSKAHSVAAAVTFS